MICNERDKSSPDYCKDYRLCAGKEWFGWEDLRWCPHQNYWLMINEELLGEGIWPSAPDYIDKATIQKAEISEAYFYKGIMAIVIIYIRLKRVSKRDKLKLWDEIRFTDSVGDHKRFEEINGGAKSALLYISGWYPKRTSYTDYKKKKNYRDRGGVH